MNHLIAAAFIAASTSVASDEFDEWMAIAADRGATPAEIAQARRLWEREQQAQVQVVGGAR